MGQTGLFIGVSLLGQNHSPVLGANRLEFEWTVLKNATAVPKGSSPHVISSVFSFGRGLHGVPQARKEIPQKKQGLYTLLLL